VHAKFEVARGSGIRDRGGVKFGLAGREPVAWERHGLCSSAYAAHGVGPGFFLVSMV